VLLSFLIQMRDSRETISDLHESNASALENALQLQEENQALTAANGELTEKISDLEAQAQTAADEAEATKTDLELQLAQAETRREEAEAESQQTLADTQAAYDLLLTAQTALSAEDRPAAQAALDELGPQRAFLSPAAQAQYDRLLADLTAEEAPGTQPQ